MLTNILHEKGNMTDLLQIEKQERTRFKVTTQHKIQPNGGYWLPQQAGPAEKYEKPLSQTITEMVCIYTS